MSCCSHRNMPLPAWFVTDTIDFARKTSYARGQRSRSSQAEYQILGRSNNVGNLADKMINLISIKAKLL